MTLQNVFVSQENRKNPFTCSYYFCFILSFSPYLPDIRLTVEWWLTDNARKIPAFQSPRNSWQKCREKYPISRYTSLILANHCKQSFRTVFQSTSGATLLFIFWYSYLFLEEKRYRSPFPRGRKGNKSCSSESTSDNFSLRHLGLLRYRCPFRHWFVYPAFGLGIQTYLLLIPLTVKGDWLNQTRRSGINKYVFFSSERRRFFLGVTLCVFAYFLRAICFQ